MQASNKQFATPLGITILPDSLWEEILNHNPTEKGWSETEHFLYYSSKAGSTESILTTTAKSGYYTKRNGVIIQHIFDKELWDKDKAWGYLEELAEKVFELAEKMYFEKVLFEDMTNPAKLSETSKEDLIEDHNRLHRLANEREEGQHRDKFSWGDLIQRHGFVMAELGKSGIKCEFDDELAKAVEGLEEAQKMELDKITPESLHEVSQEELLSLHRRLHQLAANYQEGARGQYNWEDFVNLHSFVLSEFEKRNFEHNKTDKLDEDTAKLSKKETSSLKDKFDKLDNFLVREKFICLVGKQVKSEEPSLDGCDILFREIKDHPSLDSYGVAFSKQYGREEPWEMVVDMGGPHDEHVVWYDLWAIKRPEWKIEEVVHKSLDIDKLSDNELLILVEEFGPPTSSIVFSSVNRGRA